MTAITSPEDNRSRTWFLGWKLSLVMIWVGGSSLFFWNSRMSFVKCQVGGWGPYFLDSGHLTISCYSTHHCCVNCKLNNFVLRAGRSAVQCVEWVLEGWTQNLILKWVRTDESQVSHAVADWLKGPLKSTIEGEIPKSDKLGIRMVLKVECSWWLSGTWWPSHLLWIYHWRGSVLWFDSHWGWQWVFLGGVRMVVSNFS